MENRDIVISVLGLQITVLFGILSLTAQIGSIVWTDVMYMGIGVLVTIFALVS